MTDVVDRQGLDWECDVIVPRGSVQDLIAKEMYHLQGTSYQETLHELQYSESIKNIGALVSDVSAKATDLLRDRGTSQNNDVLAKKIYALTGESYLEIKSSLDADPTVKQRYLNKAALMVISANKIKSILSSLG